MTETHNAITSAASRFSNVLRLYAEASLNTKPLFRVDSEEAIDNLDRAFDGLLSGLHSLCDAMRDGGCTLDWYGHGDTAACILVRNARHHNLAGLFQSWNNLMLKQGQLTKLAGAAFLMVGYELDAQEGRTSEYYVPWDDFRAMLDLPQKESRLKDVGRLQDLFDEECGFATIKQRAIADRFPMRQVFVNMIPIVMNVSTRVFTELQDSDQPPAGFDWGVYADHFASAPLADLRRPSFKVIRSPA